MTTQADFFGDHREISPPRTASNSARSKLFSKGVNALVRAGIREGTARAFIAKQLKRGFGAELLLDAVLAADDNEAVEPVSYVVEYCQRRKPLSSSWEEWVNNG